MNIAVVIIAYNRVDSLTRLINSLKNAYYDENQKVDLIISVDRSNNEEVYKYVDSIQWEYGAIFREYKEKNMGLRAHIMSCGEYFDKYNQDALIILEDDLFVAQNYCNFAVECVEKYSADDNIGGISLYSMARSLHTDLTFTPLKGKYDAYFMKYAQSWGQVWLKKQWKAFKEWYDRNLNYNFKMANIPENVKLWPKTSWLRYHIAYCIENDKYFVYPYESLTTNFAEPGVHYKSHTNKMQVRLQYGEKKEYLLPNFLDKDAIKYDGFEENEDIYKYIGVDRNDLSVDLYGLKKNINSGKRYLLTKSVYDYHVVNSYDLSLIPHERNVIEGVKGDMIFLYDTSLKDANANKGQKSRNNDIWNYYYYSPNLTKYNVTYFQLLQIIKVFLLVYKTKIKRIIRKRK